MMIPRPRQPVLHKTSTCSSSPNLEAWSISPLHLTRVATIDFVLVLHIFTKRTNKISEQ